MRDLTSTLVALNTRYQLADLSERDELRENIRQVAAARQQKLAAMMENNPAEVLRVALPQSIRTGMPEEVRRYLEQEVRLEGELEILYEDSRQGSRLLYYLTAAGKKLSLHFVSPPSTRLQTGDRVRINGVQVGEALALDSGNNVTSVSSVVRVNTNTFGEHKVLVILVNFQDKQTQPFTVESARNVIFGTTSNFFREASYGQTWLTGDVYGWFTIPVSYTTCDTTAIANYAKQAAAAAGANLSAYNHYVYAFPSNTCSWTGHGTVGGNPSEVWINDWFELGIVGHELGHNFGLYHSRSMDCGSAVIGGNCTTDEYGDTLDIMGDADVAHFNLFQKERLGWVNYGSSPPITTVTSSGSYWVDAYEQTGSTAKGLKILKSTDPATGKKTWYYIEHRSASGFDSFLSGNSNVLNGVVVHTGSEASGQEIYLLDLTPATASWYDPALVAGQSFSDSAAGVTITTVSADSTGAMVNVSFAPQPCTRANPTLTLSPSQSQWVTAGTTVSYTITVRNNDSSGCASSSFNLQANVPSGWAATFAAPSLILSPGGSASTTLQVTSPAWATDGFYNLGVTAANSSVAAYTATSSVTYVIVSSLGVTVSSESPSYTRNQTASVTASVRAGGSPVSGASVAFTMTRSDGAVVTSTASTGANGTAVFRYSFNRKRDPTGTYQVRAVASVNGLSGSGQTSFVVK
ncbi:MAG TPA: NEW3 domain-containing protein [Blastocatellia bacterium]|nr:NEW3 domain-containing protein [Blastocatellia bacterium]